MLAPLIWLALGAFAVGTEGFMIAPILPRIADDLSITLVAAGQVVTIFALAYGLSSPILTALTGRVARRPLLIGAMAAFALANLVAAAAPDYWSLVAARVLLAFSAGLYVPGANALAGAMVAPEKRGRAIAVVNGGLTLAVTLGVPLGAVIGNALGWRMTFIAVAGLSAAALIGLFFGLPEGVGAGMTSAGFRQRIAVAKQPGMLASLLVTLLWAIGAYTVYTYVAPFMAHTVNIDGGAIGGILFLWGLSAAVGLAVGGAKADRLGPDTVVGVALLLAVIALASLSNWAHFLTPHQALVPVLVTVALWGMAHWGFWPAQQARLIGIAGLPVAPVALSLNASFMYLGFSLGAGLGSLTMQHLSVADLGWAGATSVLASLILFAAITRSRKTASNASPLAECSAKA